MKMSVSTCIRGALAVALVVLLASCASSPNKLDAPLKPSILEEYEMNDTYVPWWMLEDSAK